MLFQLVRSIYCILLFQAQLAGYDQMIATGLCEAWEQHSIYYTCTRFVCTLYSIWYYAYTGLSRKWTFDVVMMWTDPLQSSDSNPHLCYWLSCTLLKGTMLANTAILCLHICLVDDDGLDTPLKDYFRLIGFLLRQKYSFIVLSLKFEF